MTREEALRYAQHRIECHSKGDRSYTKHGEFLVAAIEALEKQIPKKPIVNSGEPLNIFREYRCSVCGARVGEQSYCIQCGQAIDCGG